MRKFLLFAFLMVGLAACSGSPMSPVIDVDSSLNEEGDPPPPDPGHLPGSGN